VRWSIGPFGIKDVFTLVNLMGGDLGATLGVYLATFVVCFVSGFVPLVNAETYLISTAVLTPTSALVPLALLATAGQMAAKVLMYLAGKGAIRLAIMDRAKDKMVRLSGKLDQSPRRVDLFLFVSASVGIPPFYVVSLLAGASGVPFVRFLAAGTTGRFVRFVVTLGLPHLVKGWIL